MASKSERFEMRLEEEMISSIDQWRTGQTDNPSRAEAIRRLIENGLSTVAKDGVTISDGEKLILLMLRDMYKHLKITKGESDPDFIADVIFGGHMWALKWKMQGVFHGHRDNPKDLRFVLDVMDLWDILERSFSKLSKKEKEKVEVDAAPFGKHVRFTGFDGNEESELLGIAHFLVEKMERFQSFKDRELNSHMPSIDLYRRMLEVFTPMKSSLMGGNLGVNQIISILKVMIHPNNRK